MNTENKPEKVIATSRFFRSEAELLEAFFEFRNRENHVYADHEIEKAVLAAILLDSEVYYKVMDLLKKPEIFYHAEHQIIFSTIKEIISENKKPDLLTLTSKLMQLQLLDQAGGAIYLYQLTSRIASSTNVEYHAQILVENFVKRQMQRFSLWILQQLNTNVQADINDFINMYYNEADSYNDFGVSRPIRKVAELLPEFEKKIEEMQNNETDYNDVTSGFDELDQITNGFTNGNMVVIAARPSIGKTAFALSIADRMVKRGFPVGFFSSEMTNMELVERLASVNTGINGKMFRQRGKFTGDDGASKWQKLENFLATYKYDFFLEDTPNIPIAQLRYKAKRMKRNGAKVIIIDYLQLLQSGKGWNRYEEVTILSSSIKSLAKELDMPIIILSQLNRASESKDKRPELAHLRESGAIEQDADVVMLLHRPEFYGITEYMPGESGEVVDTKGKAWIIIAKHRNGELGDVMLGYQKECTKFQSFKDVINDEAIPF